MTPKTNTGLPSFVTIAGMIVWNGRLPGSSRLAWFSSSENRRAAVLDGEAEVGRGQAGAEAEVVALDERHAVAVLVHHAQVDRVRLAELRVAGCDVGQRLRRVDELSPRVRVRLADQFLDRHLGELRVGVELRPVGVRELLRLDEQVPVVRRRRAQLLQVVALRAG